MISVFSRFADISSEILFGKLPFSSVLEVFAGEIGFECFRFARIDSSDALVDFRMECETPSD
jgi:hypothetical protein